MFVRKTLVDFFSYANNCIKKIPHRQLLTGVSITPRIVLGPIGIWLLHGTIL